MVALGVIDSYAPDGALLYGAQVVFSEWTPEKAERYAARGYTHYHESVSGADGVASPDQDRLVQAYYRNRLHL
ncbi:MAG: hypothetical protein WA996_15240 [Candidatus Promineifilaceae bacterium]